MRQFKFNFGDIVIVDGLGDELFMIETMCVEIEHSENEEPIEEISYICYNINDYEDFVKAYEEDLQFIESRQSFNIRQIQIEEGKNMIKEKEKRKKEIYQIDELLDRYNDYIFLYNHFKDPRFKASATRTINKLKKLKDGEVT